MDPVSAIIGGGMGLAGQGLNFYEQQQQNTFNQQNMQSQMAFETNMSNTAHTREVADLKNAGINPIYTAGGSGATTPSAPSGTNFAAPQVNLPAVFSNMMDYSQKAHQIDQGDRALDLQAKQTAINDKTASADIANKLSDTDLKRMQTVLTQKGLPEAMLHGAAAKQFQKMLDWISEKTLQPSIPLPSSGGEMRQP